MNTQPEEPTWGPPPVEPKRSWTPRRAVAAVGVALGLAAGSGAVVYASSGDDGAPSMGRGGQGELIGPGGPIMCPPPGDDGDGRHRQGGGKAPAWMVR